MVLGARLVMSKAGWPGLNIRESWPTPTDLYLPTAATCNWVLSISPLSATANHETRLLTYYKSREELRGPSIAKAPSRVQMQTTRNHPSAWREHSNADWDKHA